jgi:hypothetical protein
MQELTCVGAEGCDEPIYVKARRLCRTHYNAAWKDGFTAQVPKGPAPNQRGCTVEGCPNKHKGHGYCKKHLDQERAAGRLLDMSCLFEGCERPRVEAEENGGLCLAHRRQRDKGKELTPLRAYNKRSGTCAGPECEKAVRETVDGTGYCSGHGFQARNGRELTVINRENLKGQPCIAVNGRCGRTALTRDGLCRTHYRYQTETPEDWDRPIPEKAPNGAGHLNVDGYRVITVNGVNMMEHRYKAAQTLGRPLLDTEDVHHINGNRSDNRTNGPFRMTKSGKLRSGNLEIWSTKQPKGQEIGPKIEWAIEMLTEYAGFLTEDQRASLAALTRGPVIRGEVAPHTVLVPPAGFIQDALVVGIVEEAERALRED